MWRLSQVIMCDYVFARADTGASEGLVGHRLAIDLFVGQINDVVEIITDAVMCFPESFHVYVKR